MATWSLMGGLLLLQAVQAETKVRVSEVMVRRQKCPFRKWRVRLLPV